MKFSNTTTISRMFCTACGNEGLPIPRKAGQQREAGHLKELYCPTCMRLVNHCEVRPFGSYTEEDFKMEFELGRFLPSGLRVPIKDLEPCGCTKCRCNVNGKCWNSNKSYADTCERIKHIYMTDDKEHINKAMKEINKEE